MCIPIVIAITFIIFAILSFTPGDPARNKLGNLASKEAVEELREEWGLNDPFLVRYVNYMKGLLHGDMGRSYTKDTVVAEDHVMQHYQDICTFFFLLPSFTKRLPLRTALLQEIN